MEFSKTNALFSTHINLLLRKYVSVMHLKLFVDHADTDLKIKYISNAVLHNINMMQNFEFIDAGFDLYTPTQITPTTTGCNKIDLGVICSATLLTNTYANTGTTTNSYVEQSTGYYMYPRSSLSKTRLRLANSVGIIDSSYRGHLIGMFDYVPLLGGSGSETPQPDLNLDPSTPNKDVVMKFDRLVQICAPSLIPIYVEVVENMESLGAQTQRGGGGFGSTGR
jgi:dUTP pyrophosphatase